MRAYRGNRHHERGHRHGHELGPRAFGRDGRIAWFAVPLVYNRLFFMGFVPFLLGVPFWLLTIAATERAFAGRNTTTEVLARHVFDGIAGAIGRGELGPGASAIEHMRVTLHESHIAWASYEAPLER